MPRINIVNDTVTVILSVPLTVLMGLFFPASGAGTTQSHEFSSLSSATNPKQIESPDVQGQVQMVRCR